MWTNLVRPDKGLFLRLSWLWPLVLILPILCSSPLKAEPQNQSEQEKKIMTHGSGSTIPPLDLQVPKVTETATFALG